MSIFLILTQQCFFSIQSGSLIYDFPAMAFVLLVEILISSIEPTKNPVLVIKDLPINTGCLLQNAANINSFIPTNLENTFTNFKDLNHPTDRF